MPCEGDDGTEQAESQQTSDYREEGDDRYAFPFVEDNEALVDSFLRVVSHGDCFLQRYKEIVIINT